ncbi:carbohydrate ABC transporter permease, partial [bacterium]|nr:carbohydrate ABC transporter permease [bacterium]
MDQTATLHDREMNAAYRVRRSLGRTGVYAGLMVGVVLMIVPFWWMVATSLKSPLEILEFPPTWVPTGHFAETGAGEWEEVYIVSRDQTEATVTVRAIEGGENRLLAEDAVQDRVRFRFSNYVEAWNQAPFARYYFNTIFVTVFVVLGVLVTSSLAAYAFARMRFWGRDNIFLVFLSMMMVPQPVYIVPSYIVLARLGWIDTYQALIVPWLAHIFSIFMLRQHFKTIPNDLYDAAI